MRRADRRANTLVCASTARGRGAPPERDAGQKGLCPRAGRHVSAAWHSNFTTSSEQTMYAQVPRAAAMEGREGRGPPTHRVRRGPRRRGDGRGRHGLPPVGGPPPRRDGPGRLRPGPAPGGHEDPGEGGTGAASSERRRRLHGSVARRSRPPPRPRSGPSGLGIASGRSRRRPTRRRRSPSPSPRSSASSCPTRTRRSTASTRRRRMSSRTRCSSR